MIAVMDEIDKRIEVRHREFEAQFPMPLQAFNAFLFDARVRMHAADLPADDMSDCEVIRWALQPFCDSESARWEVRDPFIPRPNEPDSFLNNWIYATDSRIAVRIGIHAVRGGLIREWTQQDGRRPPAQDIFRHPSRSFEGTETEPWPTTELVGGDGPCLACDGKGGLGDECAACSGCGCRLCHESGNGPPYCLTCKGQGSHFYPSLRPVGDYLVARWMELKILALPGLRLIPPLPENREPRTEHSRFSAHPIQFTFSGGQGMVMPVDLDRAQVTS